MISTVKMALAALLAISTICLAHPIRTPRTVFTSPALALNCSATTLRLRPGLNPPPRNAFLRIAPDIPRGRFTVSLPLYPGATALRPYVATPYPEYSADPYLQTASAEYQVVDNSGKVQAWFEETLHSCGWQERGTWESNAPAFTNGISFVSRANRDLSLELSFGGSDSGGTYIGYGVEEITLPPRPLSSFLRGPFAELRIALQRGGNHNGQFVLRVVHTTVRNRRVIEHLVSAINAIKGYRTVLPICLGGPTFSGPAWLSFVRPDRSVVHAYESGPGACGGLAVNGVRWLSDTGAVWAQIHAIVHRR